MHHPTDRITHTTAFVTPVVEHWLEREIAQWVHPMKDRSDDPSHHERFEMMMCRLDPSLKLNVKVLLPVCRVSDVRRGVGSVARCNGTESALDCVPVCRNPDHVVDTFDRQVLTCRNGVWDASRPKVASCTGKNVLFIYLIVLLLLCFFCVFFCVISFFFSLFVCFVYYYFFFLIIINFFFWGGSFFSNHSVSHSTHFGKTSEFF